jgi:exosortase/archaeosortase family protein
VIPIPDKHNTARRLWPSLAAFLVTFLVLQIGWTQARGTALEHWVVDRATVRTSVALINALTPQANAEARGPRIVAPGGGINVSNGCEGTEVLFLLVAALFAYPFSWGLRMVGLTAGVIYVFLINQIRLVALFYAFRNDRPLFNHLHGVVAPLVLILLTSIFFVGLQSCDRLGRRR